MHFASVMTQPFGPGDRWARAEAGARGTHWVDRLTCSLWAPIWMEDSRYLSAAWLIRRCGISGRLRPTVSGAAGLHLAESLICSPWARTWMGVWKFLPVARTRR